MKFGLFKIDKDSKNSRTDRDQRLKRQVTKGAEALKIIIEESVNQDKTTKIADSAISRAKTDYGIFTADGSSIVNSHKNCRSSQQPQSQKEKSSSNIYQPLW